jgi:O-antigen/teichoic acid export membrane protein
LAGLDIAKSSIRGSLVLLIGNLGNIAASAISIIVIARLLGPTGYGLYTLALVIPGILQSFVDFGVYTAVIRYSAYFNSIGKSDEAKGFTINAIKFLWLSGLVFTLANFVFANVLSSLLLHRPDLTPYVELVSIVVLGNTIFQTIVFASIGWGWMTLSSAAQVVQSLLKLALCPLLIVVGLSVSGALIGYTASLVVAGLMSTAVLYLKRIRGPSTVSSRFATDVKIMLRFGFAPYLGNLTSVLATYFATIVLAMIVNNTTFGFYQAALNFLAPVIVVSSAMVSALFPAFASVDGKGGDAQAAFRHAYKFVAFLITPIIFFLVSASGLLITVFYGASFRGSIPYLQLLALAYLPIAFGYTVHAAFFNGFGRTRLTLVLYLAAAITLATGVPLFSILLHMGVDGVILATFLSYFIAWAVGTALARSYMQATLDLRANASILLVSAISYAATLLVPRILSSNVLTLIVYLVVFSAVYVTLAPVSRTINMQDIEIIDHTFRDVKFVGRVVSLILRYERLLLIHTSRGSTS